MGGLGDVDRHSQWQRDRGSMEEEITTYAETQGDWVETKLDGWDKGEGWRCTDRYYGE